MFTKLNEKVQSQSVPFKNKYSNGGIVLDFLSLNYTYLSEAMNDFYQLTGIRISFWNTEAEKIIMAPDDADGGLKNHLNGNSAFCSKLRAIPEIDAQCHCCDLQALQQNPRKGDILYSFQCVAGLTEYIVPAYFNNHLLGNFMFGQIRSAQQKEKSSELRQQLYRDYQLDPKEMESLYEHLPCVNHDFIMAAARILRAIGSHAYYNGLFVSSSLPLSSRIYQYVQTNFMRPINVQSICEVLHISRSTLSQTMRREIGCSFVTFVNDVRIDNVKKCMQNGMSITEAAYRSGFRSTSYMYRAFRARTGISPSVYKNMLKNEEL